MSEVKWIKISTGIFDDEKIKLIEAMPDADTILVVWIKLLALAGRQNDHGEVYLTELTPYNDNMLAKIFNRKESTVKLAMRTFVEFGMVEILDNQAIAITNWGKHQNIDGLEKIREGGRLRVQKYRANQKLLCNKEENREEENRIEGNVTVTLRDALQDAEVIYAEYPNKVGKPAAIKAILKALESYPYAKLYDATEAFARARPKGTPFTPHPATWFNQERFNDDPATWKPNSEQKIKHRSPL